MKKLLMTLGIILGFTAVVSAQSAVKEAESVSVKPTLLETPKTNTVPVAVVTTEKAVTKETPSKVVVKTDAASQSKPVNAVKGIKPADAEKPAQTKESKLAKTKDNS